MHAYNKLNARIRLRLHLALVSAVSLRLVEHRGKISATDLLAVVGFCIRRALAMRKIGFLCYEGWIIIRPDFSVCRYIYTQGGL